MATALQSPIWASTRPPRRPDLAGGPQPPAPADAEGSRRSPRRPPVEDACRCPDALHHRVALHAAIASPPDKPAGAPPRRGTPRPRRALSRGGQPAPPRRAKKKSSPAAAGAGWAAPFGGGEGGRGRRGEAGGGDLKPSPTPRGWRRGREEGRRGVSGSNYLAILELQDSEVTEVPTSIGSLLNLRYIGLRRTKVKSLPDSIENLSNLHTLDIKQTKIERLPRGVVKIKKLRHLLADRYADEKQTEFRYFMGVQAPKELSNLEELQTLETVESNSDLAEQLKKLMQLRSVWIDNISAVDCAKLFATLSTLPLLSSLLLSARDENEALCFKALQPSSTHLHRLIIRGQWAKGTLNCPIFLRYGENLKYLALSGCHLGEDPLGMLALHVPNLTYLKLNNMHSPKTLVLSADSYPNLKTLVLKHMHDVSELKIIDGALPCIDGLYIVSLSKLGKVPQGIESLRSLKKLWLLRLHEDFRTQWDTKGMHQKILHVPEVRV